MKEDVKKYLGLKVRAIREAAGMTQEELAATCDVSWRTISKLLGQSAVRPAGRLA